MKKSVFILLSGILFLTGCMTPDPSVSDVAPADRSAYYGNAMLQSGGYSFRTQNFLRANLYQEQLKESPEKLLKQLETMNWSRGQSDLLEIMCDIAYNLGAHRSDPEDALPYYLSSALYAYRRLFFLNTEENRTRFDPSYCQMLLHYNASVAKIFEYLRTKNLAVHDSFELSSAAGERVRFLPPENHLPYGKNYKDLIPCAAYRINDLSLINQHFGIGVPLVALALPEVRQGNSLLRRLPMLPMPATLILRFEEPEGKMITAAKFALYDTFVTEQVAIGTETVPLARDYSTPIAAMSRSLPLLTEQNLIFAMLNPDEQEEWTGLYLLEPYNPEKIPVVFVHGLMSSPATWIRMINFLRHYPYIRQKYQFWFYRYSSGNPVMASAEILSRALTEAEKAYAVTPEAKKTFSRMVLVGHSMGGLISRVLTQDRAEYFVEQYSGEKWADFSAKLTEEERLAFQDMFFRKPDYISRMVMMAVPHRGSSMAKWSIARFFSNLVSLPSKVLSRSKNIFLAIIRVSDTNTAEDFRNVMAYTGIDNLDPDNPFIRVISESPFGGMIPKHSIIGNNACANTPGGTDGVVPYSSSHVDGVESELIVKSGHSVHQTPEAMRELARILLLHLKTETEKEEKE